MPDGSLSRLRASGFVLLVGLLLQGPIGAQEAGARRSVEQKLVFVRQLLTDSPATRRITASGNAAAIQQVEEGRAQLERAAAAFEAGDLAAAETAANAAIWALGRARQLVPDDMNRVIAERVRYQQLLLSAERMVPTFRSHLARAGVSDAPDLSAALALVEEARTLAASERLTEANRALLQAERHLLVGLNRTIADRTLVYTAHFESPDKEFDYELERFKSFVELVPIALAEFKPGADAQAQVQQLLEQGQGLRAQATAQAANRGFDAALVTLRAGTQLIQRALSAAGLVIPTQ
ncbi:MAG: hypothetical protein MUC86_12990 [Burkholderiaceae bacterium]|jgi:hypothetical protein|nr:hypothetical protein [Burkholderiaceae bacterium]